MDKQYYHEYYTLEREHWWFRARSAIIDRLLDTFLAEKKDLRILNIGVATGATSTLLEKYGTVKSIEYDDDCFSFLQEQTNLDVIKASVLALPFGENTFDLVCAFDVIEHVENDLLASREIKRVCKENGVVFVTVPALNVLWGKHDEINHHFRRYSHKRLRSLFMNEGDILLSSYFNSFLFFPVFLVRRASRFFPFMFKRTGAGSDFSLKQASMFSAFFYKIMGSESFLLCRNMRLPIGVSALLIWRKHKPS